MRPLLQKRPSDRVSGSLPIVGDYATAIGRGAAKECSRGRKSPAFRAEKLSSRAAATETRCAANLRRRCAAFRHRIGALFPGTRVPGYAPPPLSGRLKLFGPLIRPDSTCIILSSGRVGEGLSSATHRIVVLAILHAAFALPIPKPSPRSGIYDFWKLIVWRPVFASRCGGCDLDVVCDAALRETSFLSPKFEIRGIGAHFRRTRRIVAS